MTTSVSYLGLSLAHPFMAGASPLSAHLDTLKRLEDGGCSAIVLHSLFEEQITLATSGRIHHMDPFDPEFAAALADFPSHEKYPLDPAQYVEHLRRAKETVGVPVIASLNGTSNESWLAFGRLLQDAGADALELNVHEVVTDLKLPGVAVEKRLSDIVTELKRYLSIPIAVKVSPFFTAFGNLAHQLDTAGADGLVLFNRCYQPDIDIRNLTVTPTLELSDRSELRLRLRWLAILHGRVRAGLAATGGVTTPTDGIKAVLAGAHVVQIVSAILRHGPAYFLVMRRALEGWLDYQHASSVDEVRGKLSLHAAADASVFDRANYIRTLQSWHNGF